MRRIFNWDKKYLYWGVTAFCVIACSILFYMALAYLPVIGTALKSLARILSPFIWGLIITYLLAPLYKGLYQGFFLPLTEKLSGKKKKGSPKLAKGLSVLLSIIVFLAMITALVYLIIPQLYSSVETIVNNSPGYIDKLSEWSKNTLANYPELDREHHWQRFSQHMDEKYSVNGYIRLWIPGSPNEQRLKELRAVIAHPALLRKEFERLYDELASK